jgi:hypothetical protein
MRATALTYGRRPFSPVIATARRAAMQHPIIRCCKNGTPAALRVA